MVSKELNKYITVISNGAVLPLEDLIGTAEDKLIYKLVFEFKDKSKLAPSIKFIKRLISKLRILNPIIYEKTRYNRYELKLTPSNDLFILEYYQGELKKNKNGNE